MKKPAAPPRPKVAIAVPAGAREVKEEKGSLAFQVAAGQGQATVEAMRAALLKDGWEEQVASLDKLGGVVSLKKGRADLMIHYIDTGLMPAEVTVSGIGAEVEAKKGK